MAEERIVRVIAPTTSKADAGNAVQATKRRVAAYARVSTDEDEQLTSYQNQVEYYTRYIKSRPDWEFIGLYADEGISGLNTKKRSGFRQMVEDAMNGRIDLILTKSISRFARNTVDSLVTIRELKAKGVEVFFEKENIYTFDSKGELMITIMSSIAQEESRSISENITWGMRKNMARGKVTMAYGKFLGYRRGADGKPEIVEEEAEVVRRIYRLYLDGHTVREITRILTGDGIPTPSGKNCNWSVSTIMSILRNEKYKGDALLQKVYTADFLNKKMKKNNGVLPQYYVENSHPAIIDEETFLLVQELREHRRRPTRSGITSMFSGLLYCADCGEKLYYSTVNNYKREQAYFFCSSYRKNSDVCSAHYIREKVVAKAVLDSMQRVFWYVQCFEKDFARNQMAAFGEEKRKELSEKRRELAQAKKRVKEIDSLIQKIYEDNVSGKISDGRFATMSMAFEDEQKQLKESIPNMEQYLETETDKSDSLQRFIDRVKCVTQLTELTPETVHEFIEKIVVSKPEYIDGQRYQSLDIYYNSVGIVREPMPEEMEELFQEHMRNRTSNQSSKTA